MNTNTIRCESCGSPLVSTENPNFFKCEYCENLLSINNFSNSVDINKLLARGYDLLELSEWESALTIFNNILQISPRSYEAYIGCLLIKLGISKIDLLSECIYPFYALPEYKLAVKYSNDSGSRLTALSENSRNKFEKLMKNASNDSDTIEIEGKEIFNFSYLSAINMNYNDYINYPEQFSKICNINFYYHYQQCVAFFCEIDNAEINDISAALGLCRKDYLGEHILIFIHDNTNIRNLLSELSKHQILGVVSTTLIIIDDLKAISDKLNIKPISKKNDLPDIVKFKKIFVKGNKIVFTLSSELKKRIEDFNEKESEDAQVELCATWIRNKKCRHCGGEFEGLFIKKCSLCKLPKDY